MNTPETLHDDDIHAFARPAAPVTPPPARRRRWPWVLLALALTGLLLLGLLAGLAWHVVEGAQGLADAGDWRIVIGPEAWHGELGPGGALAAVLAAGLALLITAVVVPLVLLGAGLAVALAVGLVLALTLPALLLALALGLGAALLVLLIVSSPLWLVGLLLWWALRPSRPAAPAVASTASA
jgi:hypothetical protein